MKVAIIKYNAGNVRSVTNALKRLGVEPVISDDKDILLSADKVIFPGVGEASTAMNYLCHKELDSLLPKLKMPVLGVCLGLQLMCEYTEENDTSCLGIFPQHVKRFSPGKKVPHMGWNTIGDLKGGLLAGIDEGSYLYFVHSYYAELSENTIASSKYGEDFSAAVHKDNFYAVQAHPEKSSKTGAQILENFLEL